MLLDLVMQQVISRLQPDFEVATQPWPECSFVSSFVCLFVNKITQKLMDGF